ncbi:hypothetical protein IAT38_002157 [Cryptococcus sp. DSM 104549]
MLRLLFSKLSHYLTAQSVNVPAFVWDTVERIDDSPPRRFISDHPIVSYWSYGSSSSRPLYFTHVRADDGLTITRRELCKAWGCAFQGARFYHTVMFYLRNMSEDERLGYEDQLARVESLLAEFVGCADEICNALDILVQWEKTHHLPATWDPTGPYNPHKLSNAPNRLRNPPVSGDHPPAPPTLTPLFIVAAFHVIDLVEQGFDDEWWEIRESYAADRADKLPQLVKTMRVLRMPAWVPVDDEEVAPRRRKRGGEERRSEDGVDSGVGVREAGLVPRRKQKREDGDGHGTVAVRA